MTNKGKLLIVDDEPDFTEFIQWQLRQSGYMADIANSGDAALGRLASDGFDVLLADIRMPGMDGIELVGRVLKKQPDLQCIVITGHGDIETAIEAMRAGAVNYLRKPASMDEIELAIEKALEKLQLIRDNRNQQIELEKTNRELSQIRKQLESALAHETTQRREIEAEVKRFKLRDASVELINYALRCWKSATQKTKIDFAEESRIWSAVIDSNGTYRTRTLDKYLKTDTLPNNPRFRDVLDTGYFVLSTCDLDTDLKAGLEEKVAIFEQLMK